MFGVFGADVFTVVVTCIFVVLIGFALAVLLALALGIDPYEPLGVSLMILLAIILVGFGCTYVISQPDGYVGEAKYVENVTEYNGGSGSAVPIVEVEGKGRFPVDSPGIVSYEIGDMVPVECYFNSCDVK